jgi:hypothetical protein
MIKTTTAMIDNLNQRNTIMNIRTIASALLAFALLAPTAFAMNDVAGSEVTNHVADYGVQYRKNMPVLKSTKAFTAVLFENGKRTSIGDFIDETAEEKNQRSSK